MTRHTVKAKGTSLKKDKKFKTRIAPQANSIQQCGKFPDDDDTLRRHRNRNPRRDNDFMAGDVGVAPTALSENLGDEDEFEHVAEDEGEDTAVEEINPIKKTRGKKALSRRILLDPYKYFVNILASASSRTLPLSAHASGKKIDPGQSRLARLGVGPSSTTLSDSQLVLSNHPTSDSDWHLVYPSSKKQGCDLTDLSANVTLDTDFSSYGGSFGDVWKGTLKNGDELIPVAVKVVRLRSDIPGGMQKLNKRLRREIWVWKGLNHPNIVPLLGTATNISPRVSSDPGTPGMVSPWMKNGNLIRLLDTEIPSRSDRLEILCDIIAGLAYLHSRPEKIIHGDISCANVLIDDRRRACLIDFGLSSFKAEFEGTSYWSSTAGGAMRCRAPELVPPYPVRGDVDDFIPNLTIACDIFSFGCVMLHVISGRRPYYNINSDAQVFMRLCSGILPSRPPDPLLADEYWALINRCWGDISTRPSASEVSACLADLL